MTAENQQNKDPLDKVRAALKKMQAQNDKLQAKSHFPNDPEKLQRVKADIQKAYELLVVPEEKLQSLPDAITTHYRASLKKVTQDKDSLLRATTCQKANLPLRQFKGRSKMTLGFLKVMKIECDTPYFNTLTHHTFAGPTPPHDGKTSG